MLTARQLQAAELIAKGKLSNRKIAEACDCSERTINVWKADPEVQTVVQKLQAQWREGVRKRGIASKDNRLSALNGLQRRSVAAMHERAKMTVAGLRRSARRLTQQAEQALAVNPTDPWVMQAAAELREKAKDLLATIPMVKTGMYRMELKTLHTGEKSYEVVQEFFFDQQLASEIRAQMEQAAIEVGDWKKKIVIEDPAASAFYARLAELLTPDELDSIEARLQAKSETHDRPRPTAHDSGHPADPESPAAE